MAPDFRPRWKLPGIAIFSIAMQRSARPHKNLSARLSKVRGPIEVRSWATSGPESLQRVDPHEARRHSNVQTLAERRDSAHGSSRCRRYNVAIYIGSVRHMFL